MRYRVLFPILALTFLLTACGTSKMSSSGTNNGPAPTISIGAPPPSGTPSPSTAGTTFSASLVSFNTPTVLVGTITVNPAAEDGTGTVAVQAVRASTLYHVIFCPFAQTPCITLTQFTSAANGQAQASFKFPQAGVWSGIFRVTNPADQFDTYDAAAIIGLQSSYVKGVFVRASSVTGGAPAVAMGADPLGFGSLSINGGTSTVNVTLEGAAANSTYILAECDAANRTGCQNMGTITTDATGNANVTFPLNMRINGVFWISRNGLQYVAAFRVP